MFYNGTIKFVEKLFICGMFFLSLCKISTSQFSLKFDYVRLSDSIPLLNIVSSPVFTILVFYVCILYVYLSKRAQHSSIIFLPVLTFNYYFIMHEYTTKANNIFTTTGSNLTLQNGLLNIHPYIIYQLYGFIVIHLVVKVSKIKTYNQYYFTSNLLKQINLLITVGILLGAWWAAQEFNWGGFWSWDPVELISLLVLLFVLNLQHKSLENFSATRLGHYILVIIIIYLIMRLGLVSTIHSFIKSTSVPYYSYCIFTATLLLCFVFFAHQSKFYQFNNIKPQIYTTRYFVLSIIVLCVFLINLVLINFDTLSYYFIFSLSNLYFIFLVIYMVNMLFSKTTTHKIYWIMLFCFSVVMYYIMNVYIMLCFTFILLFKRKTNWTLHLIAFILYITAVFFFNPLIQSYKTYNSNIIYYALTDHYTNVSINGTFISNFFLKKNIFTLTLKSYLHHGLGFTTYTKYIVSQFVSFRNNNMSVTYGEEFIFTIVLFYIFICLYNYRILVQWDVKNY